MLSNVGCDLAPALGFFGEGKALTGIASLASEAGAMLSFVQIPVLDRHPANLFAIAGSCLSNIAHLDWHISISSLPHFGQSNVQSSWPGLALAGVMRNIIIRVPQRGQSGLLIESE